MVNLDVGSQEYPEVAVLEGQRRARVRVGMVVHDAGVIEKICLSQKMSLEIRGERQEVISTVTGIIISC